MKFSKADAMTFIRKEAIAIFFIAVVFASFIFHAAHRNEHFQEDDSWAVQQIVSDTRAIEAGLLEKLRTFEPRQGSIRDGLVQMRLVARSQLLSDYFPHAERALVALPSAATYSAGPGFIYGLVSSEGIEYRKFMSRALLVTLFLFHAGVLLIYLISRRIGTSSFAATGAALLMLFSVSMYSYGYHLGSTVWNFSIELAWLYGVVLFWGKPNFLKVISYATGILIFFNYLLIFYWAGLMLAWVFIQPKNGIREWVRTGLRTARSQWFVAATAALCGFLFYPPGQSNRATTSLHTLFSDFYYIILNFFCWYTHSRLIDHLQFAVGVGIVVGVVWWIIRGVGVENDVSPARAIRLTFFFLLIIFGGLVAVGILGFAPSRHILFLAPVFFVGVGSITDRVVVSRLRSAYLLSPVFVVVMTMAGSAVLVVRATDVRVHFDPAMIDADAQGIILTRVDVDYFQRIPGEWRGKVLFSDEPQKLQETKIYFYLSQRESFADLERKWADRGFRFQVEVISSFENASGVTFPAYSSLRARSATDNLPNGLYITKLKVTKVSYLSL